MATKLVFRSSKHTHTHPPHTHPHTPTCLAYTSEDSYVLIYKVRLEFRWGPRSADPPKMVKHDVFGVISQRFPRTRFWVLGRCRVLGVSVCFHVKVLGSISKANAPPHPPQNTPSLYYVVQVHHYVWISTRMFDFVSVVPSVTFSKDVDRQEGFDNPAMDTQRSWLYSAGGSKAANMRYESSYPEVDYN